MFRQSRHSAEAFGKWCCNISMTHASRSALSHYAAIHFAYIFWIWSSLCECLVTCSYIIPALSSPSLLYAFANESMSDISSYAHTELICIFRFHKSDKAHRSDTCWGEVWPFISFPPYRPDCSWMKLRWCLNSIHFHTHYMMFFKVITLWHSYWKLKLDWKCIILHYFRTKVTLTHYTFKQKIILLCLSLTWHNWTLPL